MYLIDLIVNESSMHVYLFIFILPHNFSLKCETWSSSDMTNFYNHVVCLSPAPFSVFIQSTTDEVPALKFSLLICFIQIYITIREKISVCQYFHYITLHTWVSFKRTKFFQLTQKWTPVKSTKRHTKQWGFFTFKLQTKNVIKTSSF